MSTFNTGNPLGSTAVKDLYDNVENFDKAVNTSEIAWVDRFGNKRLSMEGMSQAAGDATIAIEAAEQAIDASNEAKQHENAAEIAADRAADAADLSQASSSTIWRASLPLLTAAMAWRPANTPGVVTEGSDAGYYLWDGSALVRSGLQPASTSEVQAIAGRVIQLDAAPGIVPVAVAGGRAVIWMEQGLLSALGVSPRLSEQILGGKIEVLAQGAITPMAVANGRVVAWFDAEGAFAVGKLSQGLTAAIEAGLVPRLDPRSVPLAADLPLATDGRGLYRARARLGALKSGASAILKVAFTGDSWTAQNRIPLALGAELDAAGIQRSGPGWISTLVPNPVDRFPFVTYSRSAQWQSEVVLGDTPVPPVYGVGLDGASIHTTATDASLYITASFSSMKVFYRQHGGTFRWRIGAGGAWATVAADNSGSLATLDISGLADESQTLYIDTAGNTGRVVLTGFYATRAASGYELLKCGIGGASANNIALIAPYARDYAAAMQPDLLCVILGTNDYRRANGRVSVFRQTLLDLIAAYRAAVPDMGVILVAPAISNGTAVTPLIDFRAAMYDLAIQNGWDFLNLYDSLGPFARANELGQWADTLHLSDAGARQSARLINTKLLGA